MPIGAGAARFEFPQRAEPKGLVGWRMGGSGSRERVGRCEKKQIAVSCPLLELSTSGTYCVSVGVLDFGGDAAIEGDGREVGATGLLGPSPIG